MQDKIKQYELLIDIMTSMHKLDLVLEYKRKLETLKIKCSCGKER